MFQFPFGTMHQLNLDWFLQQWQQLRQDWIDEEQNIEDSMQDVYDARDAAIQAKDDAVSAKNDAQTAKNAADADALKAEGFAVGEQNGTPAGPGDPYYQSNAKYYSIESGTYRYLSEAYARGTMGGTPVDPGDAGYEDNAKYYKDAAAASAQDASDDADYVRDHVTDADASALEAEGFAVGEQGGTPVSSGSPYYENNAKYYAGEAQQDKDDADYFKAAAQTAALKAEGFAVGEQNGTPVASGSPYYENNAKYYAGNMGAIVNILPKIYPTIYAPIDKLCVGSISTADFNKNIVDFSNVFSRTYISGSSPSGSYDASLKTLYLPAGRYVAEIAFLAMTNIPAEYNTNVLLLDLSFTDGVNELIRCNFNAISVSGDGKIYPNIWYRSNIITISTPGYYALTIYAPNIGAIGAGTLTFRIDAVDSDGNPIRSIQPIEPDQREER